MQFADNLDLFRMEWTAGIHYLLWSNNFVLWSTLFCDLTTFVYLWSNNFVYLWSNNFVLWSNNFVFVI